MADDAEQGWNRLREIMCLLPKGFRSPDLYNTPLCIQRYMEARPFDRRKSSERRRTPEEIEAETDALMDSLGFK